MEKLRVSTVKYANSYPMNWGLLNGPVSSMISVEFDHPSGIAEKLLKGEADIGLLPVAAIPSLKTPVIVGSYCIGTRGNVRTVMMMSNSPIDQIDTIWLDHRSVTSVNLAKVLDKYYWNRSFKWNSPDMNFDYKSIGLTEGIVIIGDQCFELENCFVYRYDLGMAWKDFTGLPFVFACWVATNDPGKKFTSLFNQSIKKGIDSTNTAINELNSVNNLSNSEIATYLKENIDYKLDQPKIRAMSLFLNYINTLNTK